MRYFILLILLITNSVLAATPEEFVKYCAIADEMQHYHETQALSLLKGVEICLNSALLQKHTKITDSFVTYAFPQLIAHVQNLYNIVKNFGDDAVNLNMKSVHDVLSINSDFKQQFYKFLVFAAFYDKVYEENKYIGNDNNHKIKFHVLISELIKRLSFFAEFNSSSKNLNFGFIKCIKNKISTDKST